MVVGYLEGFVILSPILSPKQIVLLQVPLPCAILNLLFVVNSLCVGITVSQTSQNKLFLFTYPAETMQDSVVY